MQIWFETSDNRKIEGRVVSDLGHAYEVEVTKGPRNLRGRTQVFSKRHMLTCQLEG